jgi:16S rRNA (uracil1498-N3)-methyltransferase
LAHRYYIAELPAAGCVQLHGDTAHHLATVLRLRAGAALALGDGRGRTAVGLVTEVRRDRIEVRLELVAEHAPPAGRLHVAFAPPRWQRAEWLFEHGTEVGIDAFHPLRTAHSRPQGERLDRWRKLVHAAAGQCDRAFLPTVAAATDLDQFLARRDQPARRFLASAEAPGFAAGEALGGDALLLVGPEGGLAATEQAAALAAGFVPRGLGPHTLRTETAALVGAALLRTVAMR